MIESHQQCYCCCCLLDLNYSSKLLSSKIADIPHKLKYETIIAPIFEYCFGTSDQDIVWEELIKEDEFSELNNSSCSIINLKIDWIRDETFIYSQIFNLVKDKIELLGKKLGLWNNRQFLLKCIAYNVNIFMNNNLEDSIRNDRELVLAAVKENGFTILTASDEMRNDFEIVKTALQNIGGKIDHEFKYASEELKKNREIVKLAVALFGGVLETVPVEFRDDKELVLLALESVPSVFSIASQRLKKDRQVVLKTISMLVDKGYFFKTLIHDLSVEFKNDREIVLEISKIEGVCALKYASKELRNDRQIVMQAVQQNPFAFELASSELQNDREFVKEIVKNTPECLEYAPEEYQDDKEIVELALELTPDAIYYISERLRNDTEFISKVIGKRGFKQLPKEEFSNDREIVFESIKINSRNLERASNELQNDREFILQVVRQCGIALEFVKEKFQQDREIVLTAVTQNGNALKFVGEHFFDDKEIVLKAAETNIDSNLYHRLSDRLKNDREIFKCAVFLQHFPRKIQMDRQLLMEALKFKHFHAFVYASYSLRLNDRVFAMRIVKREGLILGYLGSKFRNDKEIVSFAIQQNKEAFKFASQELKNDLQILNLFKK